MSQFFRRLRFAIGLGWSIVRNEPDDDHVATEDVLADVLTERQMQTRKWGQQSLQDWTGPERSYINMGRNSGIMKRLQYFNDTYGNPNWAHVLLEEVFEALNENEHKNLRTELVQVAAVAVSWVEDIDRKNGWNRG